MKKLMLTVLGVGMLACGVGAECSMTVAPKGRFSWVKPALKKPRNWVLLGTGVLAFRSLVRFVEWDMALKKRDEEFEKAATAYGFGLGARQMKAAGEVALENSNVEVSDESKKALDDQIGEATKVVGEGFQSYCYASQNEIIAKESFISAYFLTGCAGATYFGMKVFNKMTGCDI